MPREGLRPRKVVADLAIGGPGSIDNLMSGVSQQTPKKTTATTDITGNDSIEGPKTPEKQDDDETKDVRPAKRRRGKKGKSITTTTSVEAKPSPLAKTKKNPYGLTPGLSPFPDFPGPTPEACEEVARILTEVHGKALPPDQVPEPSLEITGCGEVPSVLDAMIRTLLSAHTSAHNSTLAFQGLVKRFGTVDKGPGKGSVDWQKVHQASLDDVRNSIKNGGLAGIKGQQIKNILDKVHEGSMARHQESLKKPEPDHGDSKTEVKAESDDQKNVTHTTAEVELSLEYIRDMEPEQAMLEMTSFSGIGVKTAACVLLFCLQEPCFAVDTHVWRICRWLKWAPKAATRDQVFSHCEVHIPANLKYTLHQLFVRHGRDCKRCNAMKITDETELEPCPIEHLLERTQTERGRKKGPKAEKTKGSMKGNKAEDNVGGESEDANEAGEEHGEGGGDDGIMDGGEEEGGVNQGDGDEAEEDAEQ